MIHCPRCQRDMREVTVQANPGQLIILDQCAQCGGIWCDKWELFRDRSDLTHKQLYCPRCTAELHVFAEPILPKEIQLQRCLRCDGIWLNRGQFRRYKEFQSRTRSEKLGAEAIVAKLPEVYHNPKAWVVTGTNGIYAYPRGEEEPDDSVQRSISAAAKIILQSLLRLVMGI